MQYVRPDMRKWNRQHYYNWGNCTRCPLCETRRNVVLWRGDLPFNILFIGEAPGKNENMDAFPFTGPSGQKLNEIIEFAEKSLCKKISKCFINTIACIPIDHPGGDIRQPSPEELTACSPRVQEFMDAHPPKVVILVGKVALKNVKINPSIPQIEIIHPSAILREDEQLQAPLFLQCVSRVVNAVEMYVK